MAMLNQDDRVPTATRKDSFSERFLGLQEKLRIIQHSDAEGDESPNDFSSQKANEILSVLREMEFPADDIVTSAEGGIAFCFSRANCYADIEVLNSGDIVAVTSNRKDQPTVWTVAQSPEGIAKTVVRIREYFRGA
jgi:hypothetical protein